MSLAAYRVVRPILAYRGRVAGGLLLLLAADAGQLVIPLVARAAIDRLEAGRADGRWLLGAAAGLVGLALAMLVVRFAWRHLLFSAGRLAELDLRTRLFGHALRLAPDALRRTRSGDVLSLVQNDIEALRQAQTMGLVAGVDATLYALVAAAAMLWLAPAVALPVLLPLPLVALAMGLSLRAIYRRWDAVQGTLDDLTERSRESLAGVRVLKAFGREAQDAARFAALGQRWLGAALAYARVDALFYPLVLLGAGACTALLLATGGPAVIAGDLSLGTFVALASYLGMLVWPMIAAGWVVAMVQRAAASLDRLEAFLARPLAGDHPAARPLAPGPGRLELRALTFSYPGASEPALHDLELQVPAGTSLGIVGPIGSGKSTLAALLLRLQEPPPGCVLLDGQDVTRLTAASLRAALAWVPQEALVFSDTVATNLRLGWSGDDRQRPRTAGGQAVAARVPTAGAQEGGPLGADRPRLADTAPDQAALEAACRLAALHEEILALPDGYESLLGERGVTLSGGQRQRLCLARALLRPARVTILDDTLSAVDAATEAAIVGGVRRALRGRTTLVISHRVSAVRALDQILVLDRGRVVQRGTHAELLAAGGYYRELARLQEREEQGVLAPSASAAAGGLPSPGGQLGQLGGAGDGPGGRS